MGRPARNSRRAAVLKDTGNNEDMEMGTNDPLELEVTDFGPIVSGQIDLRPLTVFVGPSNTGKSYLAILIYALHRFFASAKTSAIRRPTRWLNEGEMRKDLIDAASVWAEEVLDGYGSQSAGQTQEPMVVPIAITEGIRSLVVKQADSLAGEISRCFGSGLDELARKQARGKAELKLRLLADDSRSARFEHEVSFKPPTLGSVFTDTLKLVPNDELRRHMLTQRLMDLQSEEGAGKFELAFWYRNLLDSLIDLALPELVGTLHHPAYYLPADRTGVMHAHNVVVSALIESAAMTGLRPAAQMPMLSGVLADFLEQLIQIDSRHRRRRRSSVVHAERIERAILQGAVQMERGKLGSYPRFSYRPEGWKGSLPLMSASSMVSELAPVVLFLRHLVRPGDLLIIEEPESHLHPAAQVEFTRQIASLVRAGIRVLVTTHSEWVLEELSNIVLASTVPKTRKQDAGGNGVALNEDQVGVWAFNPKKRPKGTVIEEIKLNASGDLYSASFDDVSADTYNRWVTLGNLAGGDA